MSKSTGIDAISFYVPNRFLPISTLAKARGIQEEKLTKGLGLLNMAVPDTTEDAASFAANALYRLIEIHGIDPSTIGRVYLGTESAVDASKPTATYAVGAVEKVLEERFGPRSFKNCDVLDMTFACVGGVDALQNSLDWVSAKEGRQAIVIASDLAKYALESTGEYTQGAGAVAMLVKHDPRLMSIDDNWGIAMESVSDFFKPKRSFDKTDLLMGALRSIDPAMSTDDVMASLDKEGHPFWSHPSMNIEIHREEPVYDGPYSNKCYTDRINEALEHFKGMTETDFLENWDRLIFHLPYAFQGRRMLTPIWLKWLEESGKTQDLTKEVGDIPEDKDEYKLWLRAVSKSQVYRDFVSSRITPGERASSLVGNMYSASIFMSLLSMLEDALEQGQEMAGKTVGFMSYGSGSKSKVFQATIGSDWITALGSQRLFSFLESRKPIDMEAYEAWHRGVELPGNQKNGTFVRTGISREENMTGYRSYAMVSQ